MRPIIERSRPERIAKSSIVLFSLGNNADIHSSMTINNVEGRAASSRPSVDLPAPILPQMRYSVANGCAPIVSANAMMPVSPNFR